MVAADYVLNGDTAPLPGDAGAGRQLARDFEVLFNKSLDFGVKTECGHSCIVAVLGCADSCSAVQLFDISLHLSLSPVFIFHYSAE
ncbi:MAG: hypothetical protein GY820_46875 [Gammaproteobacteria bacterium]|nr:hypothetical protein [Gammaproteobacteria bacterium]